MMGLFDFLKSNKNLISIEEEKTGTILNDMYQEHLNNMDSRIKNVYDLIISRIGKENCLFLNPYEENFDNVQAMQEEIKEPFNPLTKEEIHEKLMGLNFDDYTIFAEAPKSGQTGKLYFLDSNNTPTSTEYIAKEYYESKGYNVIKAEVNFWQIIFCITFFEEIYCKYWDTMQDIPLDYNKKSFYYERQDLLNNKIEKIREINDLKKFLFNQTSDFRNYHCRLLYPYGVEFNVQCLYYPINLKFFDVMPIEDFIKIMQKYMKYPAENHAGLPDLIVYKDSKYKLVEVKKIKEQIRESQINWLSYLKKENIPTEIIRIKGV